MKNKEANSIENFLPNLINKQIFFKNKKIDLSENGPQVKHPKAATIFKIPTMSSSYHSSSIRSLDANILATLMTPISYPIIYKNKINGFEIYPVRYQSDKTLKSQDT